MDKEFMKTLDEYGSLKYSDITHNTYAPDGWKMIAASFSTESSSPVLLAVYTPEGTPAGILPRRSCCFIY